MQIHSKMLCSCQVPETLYIIFLLHSLSSTENNSQLNIYSVKCKFNLKSYILLLYVTVLIFLFFIITQHVSLSLTICFPPSLPTSPFPPWFWANNRHQVTGSDRWRFGWKASTPTAVTALSRKKKEPKGRRVLAGWEWREVRSERRWRCELKSRSVASRALSL